MTKTVKEDLSASLEALKSYRDRFRNEFISISQKLRMPNEKIKKNLEEHSELRNIENTIKELTKQLNESYK